MDEVKLHEIQNLEKELSFLIKPGMTVEQKLKVLNDSFFRSHNAGYCDHMAGREMGGEVSWETELWDKDCKYKWEVDRLYNLLKAKNADYAIAMKVRKVQPGEKIDESCSKFFGVPCLPKSMQDTYPDDGVFFAQIRCADIKDLDPECRLPHEGYLYFFLDAEMYPSNQLYMMVVHSLEEPKIIIDDYNENCNIKGLTDTYVITFEKVDAGYEGTKLLGYPSNDVDDSDDRTGLLLQYDPLEFDVPFLSTLDGYAFVFFGEDEKDKFSCVDYVVWGS